MGRRRRGFIPKFRGKNNMLFEGKIPLYLKNILDNLKEDIFNINFLYIIYEQLSELQQDEFDQIIKEFLEKKVKENQHFFNKKDTRNLAKRRLRPSKRNFESFLDEDYRENDKEDLFSYRSYSSDYRDVESFINQLKRKDKEEFFGKIKEFIDSQSNKFNVMNHSKIKKSKQDNDNIFTEKLENLKKFLNLNDLEIQIVEFIYHFCSNESFAEVFEELVKSYNLFLTLSLFLNEDEYKIKNALQKKSKLIYYGIIDVYDIYELQLNEQIFEYLSDISNLDFTDRFFKILDPEKSEDKAQILDINLFNFYKDKIKIVQSLLLGDGRSNILFYGDAGTGKTSLAKSVIASLNKKIIYVTNSQMEAQTNSLNSLQNEVFNNRITSLIIACNYAKDNNGIVIMDEADEFLNSHFSFFSIFFGMGKKESVRKNWLNDFLESHNYKIIWITNHTFLMDESVKRRFDYSIQFSTFNGETREYITSQIIKKYNLENLIQTEDLKEYFLDPSIPVGIIDNVLNQLQQIVKVQKNISKEELLQIAKELFNSNYELVYNHKFKVLNSNDQFYQIDLIHSAPHYQEVLKQIESFIHNNKNKEKNFNCLFYGLAGTGKTEFAKFIAKKFNYRVIEIQPSDIKHFFFGMSERIIKDYFKKASNGNCILIVNEIDVFLSKDPQHEAMNSIQMQFIQEMENFKGILIGTTNSIDKISARAKRRFHLKVEFLPLKKEKLQEVFLLFFSNHLPNPELTEAQKKKLMELEDICLGDFYSVKRQIEYQGELYFEEIYKKLQEEIFYRLHDKN